MTRQAGAVLGMLFLAQAAAAQFTQQGSKLVGTGAVGAPSRAPRWRSRRTATPRSSAGRTDNDCAGAAWVFTRSGGVWSQQGSKLVGSGAVGAGLAGLLGGDLGGRQHRDRRRASTTTPMPAPRGCSRAAAGCGRSREQAGRHGRRRDGRPGRLGGDLGGRQHRHRRRALATTRAARRRMGVHAQRRGVVAAGQQAGRHGRRRGCPAGLLGGDLGGRQHRHRRRARRRLRAPAPRGSSRAAAACGRSRASKLVGTGAVGAAKQGSSVAISADGNTAIVGGPGDNSQRRRRVGVHAQRRRVVAAGRQAGRHRRRRGCRQGSSVAISADGNTAIVGGPATTAPMRGAAWVFTRSGGVWSQQGGKLVGTGAVGLPQQGTSVAISADGNTADRRWAARSVPSTADAYGGAAWVFTRSGACGRSRAASWSAPGPSAHADRAPRWGSRGTGTRPSSGGPATDGGYPGLWALRWRGVGVHAQRRRLVAAGGQAGRHGRGVCGAGHRGRALRGWERGRHRRAGPVVFDQRGVGIRPQWGGVVAAGEQAGR